MNHRRALLAVIFAFVLPASGCARLLNHYDVTPDGLARSDDRLRRLLVSTPDSARLADVLGERDALPSDPLLARLYAGVLAYHAGNYLGSAAALDSATLLIDERMTHSASRSALSILSTDRVLPYQPGQSERMLLHYYAALAWLRSGSPREAAVEARRLSALLENGEAGDAGQRRLHAALRHFTAAIFALAGEHNDADVAYRNALLLAGDSTHDGPMPYARADSSDVIVFIDRGFVGHRAEQSIALWLGVDEVRGLRSGRDDQRVHIAQLVAERIALTAEQDARSGRATGMLHVDAPAPARSTEKPTVVATAANGHATAPHDNEDEAEDDDETPYLMRIAWPVFREAWRTHAPVTLAIDSMAATPFARASVSDAVARDFADQRGWLVARTVARAAAKLVLTRGIEDELREKDETAADVFAILGNVTAAVTEQADTRSWTLLPGSIEVARMRVPAGAHEIAIDTGRRTVMVRVDAPAGGMVLEHVVLH